MPGQKKRVWKGQPLSGGPGEGFDKLPIVIPDHDPGRVILVEFTREQAREIGMAMWRWGSA